MEVLNPSIPIKPYIFSNVSPIPPSFSVHLRNKKNPHIFRLRSSKFHRSSTLPIYLPLSHRNNFQISAQFGRPAHRRNSLRKKLLQDHQVHDYSINLNTSSLNIGDKLNYDSIKESDFTGDEFENVNVEESNPKLLGESELLNKLENWVDQYKKDAEYWGIGSDPIFTVFHDYGGNVNRVVVDEDEILGRSKLSDLEEVKLKISHAKSLAIEMESGGSVIPRNSSVAKFVASEGKFGFFQRIQDFALQPKLFSKLSRVGTTVLCSFIIVWAVKKLFSFKNNETYTELEKEMVRRKMKSRKERETLEKGTVEVVQESMTLPMVQIERPKLDKQELMDSILKAKGSENILALQDVSSSQTTISMDFDVKVQEIREMARKARNIEHGEDSLIDTDEEEKQDVNQHREVNANIHSNSPNVDPEQVKDLHGIIGMTSMNEQKADNTGSLDSASQKYMDMLGSKSSSIEVLDDREDTTLDGNDNERSLHLVHISKIIESTGDPDRESRGIKSRMIGSKPRVIHSVKEAREYLSKKQDNQNPNQQTKVETVQKSAAFLGLENDTKSSYNTSQRLNAGRNGLEDGIFCGTSESISTYEDSSLTDTGTITIKNDSGSTSELVDDLQEPTSSNLIGNYNSSDTGSIKKGNWMEENFHEVEPIVKKIGTGYRDNYIVAREKRNQHPEIKNDITQLSSNGDDDELEWMKDDALKEIVFQVRENEISGREPFYMMDAEDKLAFFKGLEKKVEKENEKLSHLHEWLHSNIENLDYGTDGISLYDSPEKIIPRWKGPPLEKNPEFLNNFLEEWKVIFSDNSGTSYPVKRDERSILQISTESPVNDNSAPSSAPYVSERRFHDEDPKTSKTFIEGSDGSVRPGKVSGKEYWQHTKKWSRGFLESYNAEADTETRSVMKDIGKDLDRWITEKEVQEAAELVDKMPERNKRFMEKKINKLKREMELFGPQAVVSKYREYAEEKEEDYLWWLDLPFIMCIELYTNDNEKQEIGFYSLEMAADLELEPKPCHVIAFEDAGTCKDLCYIIQAHMEMLGNGHAFVVPRPPKDAFREAKTNGFSVTVIRQGELQLNVDQTLEEVEEQITEIGSKMYHDMITRERSVDISSLMKGVFGSKMRPTQRRKTRKRLRNPSRKRH